MFSKELEEIIEAALADGVITDKERAVLHKRALAEGVDPDELDIVIDGRLAKTKKQEDWLRPAPPQNLENQKYGNVMKCPSCGAQIVGGSAVCPECGYTFSNIQANSSVEKLLAKLEDFDRREEEKANNRSIFGNVAHAFTKTQYRNDTSKRKMDIISTFPVPNTRVDLLEFLTMIQAKAKSTGPRNRQNLSNQVEDLSYAYWLLYTNCINKARLSFSKDQDFAPYFMHYEHEVSKTKGIIGFLRCNPVICVFLAAIILPIVVLSILGICGVFKSSHKNVREVKPTSVNVSSAIDNAIDKIEESASEVVSTVRTGVLSDDNTNSSDDEDVDSYSDETTSGSSSSSSEDWDALLNTYDSYVTKYISYVKKAAKGDMNALSDYPALLEKAQELSNKMEGAQGDMSSSQWARYMKINNKMLEAAQQMR